MSQITRWSATFANAPVGAETVGWDWAEDEYGYKTRYEYIHIPHEAVTNESKLVEGTREFSLTSLLASYQLGGDPDAIVMLTVCGTSGDFVALGWTRTAAALQEVLTFVGDK